MGCEGREWSDGLPVIHLTGLLMLLVAVRVLVGEVGDSDNVYVIYGC